ncbi:sugar transferase [Actinocorallia sp. A-T 12471]|uniref:sugar transferase n=1 Tax=Actinocorallia sp. A-T 12471 TaxID=3089813 RepID=UPI0029CD90FD|nr:sugar transferase [Actinocorallia sp. A-T 12471]MDX6738509.1 sugar transferase [Actinocorallia sp. A-T 12471]
MGALTARADSWVIRYLVAVAAVDFFSVTTGAGLAFLWRFAGETAPSVSKYAVFTALLPLAWLAVLKFCGAYERSLIGVGPEEFRRVFHAGFILISAIAIVSYGLKADLARSYVVVFLPLVTLLNLAARYGLRKRLHALRGQGRCMRKLIAVGHRAGVSDLVGELQRAPYHGLEVVGACVPQGAEPVGDIPVYGGFGDAAMALELAGADAVAVLSCPEMDGATLRRLSWQLEAAGADLVVAPALMDVAGPRISVRPVAGLPLLYVDHPRLSGGPRMIKAAFDFGFAAVALLLALPVMLVIALLVATTSKGGALFRQKRVGKDGRTFTVLKFRTMVADAEARKAELTPLHEGGLFKVKRDPRITRVGGFLRRYSLDELPQLLNVLRGEMSLVGPRPPLLEEVAGYGDGDVRRRLVVKPGMTGLWQVSGRSDLTWEESVRLDLRYVDNWSLALDLQIMWKTWSAVFKGAGAY